MVTKGFQEIDSKIAAGQFDKLRTDFKSCNPLSMKYVKYNLIMIELFEEIT